MKLRRVDYDDLSPKQQEIYNLHEVAWLLAGYGFNCIKLSADWQGADFLADHKDGDCTLRIQLKGRMYIAKKYIDKNLHMCFKIGRVWYLILHDVLIRIVKEHAPSALETKDWKEKGFHSWPNPSKRICEALFSCQLNGH